MSSRSLGISVPQTGQLPRHDIDIRGMERVTLGSRLHRHLQSYQQKDDPTTVEVKIQDSSLSLNSINRPKFADRLLRTPIFRPDF